MNAREIKIERIYREMRERLENAYARKFEHSHTISLEDAMAKAFEFAAKGVLEAEGEITAEDFGRRFCWKAGNLARDAWDGTNRGHGQRSVRTELLLDVEEGEDEDYRRPLVEKASFEVYLGGDDTEEVEREFAVKYGLIRQALRETGFSARDREIFDRCVFGHADRGEVAGEYGITENNVSQIVFKCKKGLLGRADVLRDRYEVIMNAA